ncbi:CCA tRNA nucleotidyltransferase [Neobacillus piezotolerans]|uniref:CCA-adding enzyme n=1 Tax=Neobacillus piezotolerans TaxID=2259171 RepID=A0A3D8GPV3_9BACI|nr:CCA tRNA nucleotidyltransferase [Neobacillus piezotolerans]RDU36367.1 CCA tRNA nucleotidyltransferase [Neobacillus piezotolerans]
MEKPFKEALPVLDAIHKAGHEAYFVGGSVRDMIVSRPIGDIDIATSARPEQIKGIFAKTVDIGIEHGTVLVLYKGNSYEVTTYRTESGYADFRRPDKVEFVTSLHEDLKRRDFTINAMAMDRNGNLIDPFGGKEDIAGREIRTVGDPADRFGEDALRMMRAARFVSQLGFKIEKATFASLKKSNSLLRHIAVERKRAEFEKLLGGKWRKEALHIMIRTGMIEYLPGLSGKEADLEAFLMLDDRNLTSDEMWVLLLYCLGFEKQEAETFLRSWKMSNRQIAWLTRLLFYMKERMSSDWDVTLLFEAGKEAIAATERLVGAAGGNSDDQTMERWLSTYEKLPIKDKKELSVSGGDIIRWEGKNGGPWVKEKLAAVERAVLLGVLENNEAKIKEWLAKCNRI